MLGYNVGTDLISGLGPYDCACVESYGRVLASHTEYNFKQKKNCYPEVFNHAYILKLEVM